jgi:hypothetical protein
MTDRLEGARRDQMVGTSVGRPIHSRDVRALWFIRREERNQAAELSWSLALTDEANLRPSVEAKVGPIQFLKQNPGFSITFEQVNYVADGLHLEGRIGNANLLHVSTLTLNFDVTKPLYQYKDDYMKAPGELFFPLLEPIGKAQAKPIETLNPGTTQPFEVTIPNVRQTKTTFVS